MSIEEIHRVVDSIPAPATEFTDGIRTDKKSTRPLTLGSVYGVTLDGTRVLEIGEKTEDHPIRIGYSTYTVHEAAAIMGGLMTFFAEAGLLRVAPQDIDTAFEFARNGDALPW